MDHTYAAKERSLKNPALYSDMDWEDDEFAKYKLPINKKGVASLILVNNRRLWTRKGLNCHVKKRISARENKSVLTQGPHDRTHELTWDSVTS